MKTVNIRLSIKDLFILDHAIQDRLGRSNISDADLYCENNLLDRVNSKIKEARGGNYNGQREKE